VGSYAAHDGKSIVQFNGDGTYTLEDRSGEVPLQLAASPEEKWELHGDRLTLTWRDGSQEQRPVRKIEYAVVANRGNIELQLVDGQRLPGALLERPMAVSICERYRKIWPNQHMRSSEQGKSGGEVEGVGKR